MTEKVIVIHPEVIVPKRDRFAHADAPYQRTADSALAEAVGLARAIHLDVVDSEIIKLKKVNSASLMGKGVLERIKEKIDTLDVGLVFVDHNLSPGQQRNLEKFWNAKVIDRTGLILEIFGARARTKEGVLQVDLAALSFQRSRLVRAWTHLERQRGGGGFMGGPGETQIELDRRILDDKIRKLKLELETVRKNRKLQRESRQKEPFPIVAIVGYTNAGKSTLFNRMTGAKVFAKDLLFATLDTTMRGVEMPSGKKAILSDTVGFISDLPTDLVAAFRATLEEVQEASVILHVRDTAQENTEAERHDVLNILRDLDIDPDHDPRLIEVMNKIDALDTDEKERVQNIAARHDRICATSAITGEGVDDLLEKIDALLTMHHKTVYVDINITDGEALSWLYRRGDVLERVDDETHAHLGVDLDPVDCSRFTRQFPYLLSNEKIKSRKNDA